MRNLCLFLLFALLWGCNTVIPAKPVKKYAVYYEYDIHTSYTSISDKDKEPVYWVSVDTVAVDTIYIPLN